MAYTVDLRHTCRCGKRGTHEVRGTYNQLYGIFCARCANKKVAELNKKQAAERS